MANGKPTAHTLNLTPQRLETARSWLRANAATARTVSRDATVVMAVGLLICDDAGHIAEAELHSAMADPVAISTAQTLLSEVLF